MTSAESPAPIVLSDIHELVGGELHGDGTATVSSLANLHETNGRALSFIANDKAVTSLGDRRPGALLVHRHLPALNVPKSR